MTDNDIKEVISNYARVARMYFDGVIIVSSTDMIAIRDFMYRLAIENYKTKTATSCQQNNCKECQYYKEHQEYECLPYDIGDTVYCVNGYGSQRYIEEFTVAEIRITKDGIWLTDTKGMEWLARVCHFSRESAEKELKAQKGLIDIVNENFDEEVIHITYESDKTPQSEEVRKDIENYIRRLKERRKNSKGNSFFYNRFMKTE